MNPKTIKIISLRIKRASLFKLKNRNETNQWASPALKAPLSTWRGYGLLTPTKPTSPKTF